MRLNIDEVEVKRSVWRMCIYIYMCMSVYGETVYVSFCSWELHLKQGGYFMMENIWIKPHD